MVAQAVPQAEAIYRAALDPDYWPCALAQLADQHAATDAVIYTAQPGQSVLSSFVSGCLPPAVNDSYLHEFAERDIQIKRLLARRYSEPLTGFDLLSDVESDRCTVHREFLQPNNIDQQLVWLIPSSTGHQHTFVLMRGTEAGPFPTATARDVSTLIDHLRRALEMGARLSAAEQQATSLLGGFTALGMGVAVLAGCGQVLQKNALLTQLLGGPERELNVDLHALSRRAKDIGDFVTNRRTSDDRLMFIEVLVLNEGSRVRTTIDAAATTLVLAWTPKAAESVSVKSVEQLFGLTSAEARLVTELTQKVDLATYARCNSLSIHTVRNQLKSVFAKTGLGNQKDLVSEVLRQTILRPQMTAFEARSDWF